MGLSRSRLVLTGAADARVVPDLRELRSHARAASDRRSRPAAVQRN